MCDSLYVKANGDLPCWCNAGESRILVSLDVPMLEAPDFDLLNIAPLVQLRTNVLVRQSWPFPECGRCAGKADDVLLDPRTTRRLLKLLHLEPSFLCNLDCPVCIKRETRKERSRPPYHMEPKLWRAIISNLERHNTAVERMLMEGRGDPLMNRDLPELIEITHKAFPDIGSELTTNGNFRFDPALFYAGLRKLRISADGAREESYRTYRRGGSFEKVLAFMTDASDCLRRTGSSAQIEWKYIIFEWNDSTEELSEAYQIAESLGCELSFFLASGYGESPRFNTESLNQWIIDYAPNANGKYNGSNIISSRAEQSVNAAG